VLRNYLSVHPTQENYDCKIWEAASATAAAPLFFKPVTFEKTGEIFGDGGMRRNNPINEAINEMNRLREKEWAGREIGCVVSIGTGAVQTRTISNQLQGLLKAAVAIMTDSEDIADQFIISELGQKLYQSKRYFRFNVPQGLQMLKMDEWRENERMRAFTTDYLHKYESGNAVKACALSLLNPDANS
jgi:patatin-like phospholipase/acyl hydrolase